MHTQVTRENIGCKVETSMATNKFATMLHRNTNKMVVILVYAVLEWLLIALLLLNSLFSYLISKFAKCVGLQPPCLWCSRVDHVLQQENSTKLHKDLVCEAHAAEISKLGYCSNHQRLAETHSMCEDCLASRPNHHENSFGMRHRIAFISWVSGHGKHENGDDMIRRCSCCNESLSSQLYPPYLLLKPSWGDKGSLIVEDSMDDEKEGGKDLEFERHNEEDHEVDEHQILSDIESFILREVAEDRSSSVSNLHSDEKDGEKDEKEDDLIITEVDPSADENFVCQFTSSTKGSHWEDRSLEVINVKFEKNDMASGSHRLVPVELIDSVTSLNFGTWKLDQDLGEREQGTQTHTFENESPIEAQLSISEREGLLLTMNENAEKTSIRELESLEDSITLELEDLKQNSVDEVHLQGITAGENDVKSVEGVTKEPDDTQVDLPQSQEPVCSSECTQEDESSSSDDDAEIQNAFDEFIAQNSLSKTNDIDNNSMEAAIQEPENLQDNMPASEEPACSCECISEDESSSSSDDDAEVQNAFDKFITQNHLSQSQSLSNDDKSIEADMEEPENTRASSSQSIPEDESSTSEDDTEAIDEFITQKNLCPDKAGSNDNEYVKKKVEKTIEVEKIREETSNESSKCSESYEVEEEKLPETPRSVDGLHYLHKRDDSVDGSVASEVECGDPVLTIDRLKTALKAERNALSAVYQELEEERSASAVAANQTMAMITRLQEEKAAMQMEALQYQRMMEEQSEYDQEALQLLNELMTKREKEKQELEKELEEYRQKVMEYEAKEKLRVLRRMKDGSVRSRDSSSSCSNVGYTDELSIDFNRDPRDEDHVLFNHEESSHNNASDDTVSNLEEMALDCVKHVSALDDTLAEFEEERASILEQLKALEEKIVSLGDNEEFLDDIKLIENSSMYCDKDLSENCNFSSVEENGYSNGFSDDIDKHSTIGSLAKKLLPYLDAAEDETEETYTIERQLESESVDMQNSDPILEMDSMKTCIEEEVDRVYERLQALETDKEFLQHCMGSIQNGGEKGVDLLQEILQHLRDLKDVELRLKTLGNDPL
ncbi:myosin-binding protein 2 isoform X2 [Cajanus cajan]|uniref:myosin-binding protein 2 isoform X2 n=1 Tax=Cajanus cajan TaxID=3821 RepID=UPI0010FB2DD3|nr:myosin-binding protein 2 isoform X2 [Cajanus cajan]